MKTLKIALAWLIAGFAIIQLIRIDVPPPPKATPDEEIQAPAKIQTMLKRSCYDCHSNHTNWPWYSKIAPVSWEVRSHVKDGRNWLNFSIWKRYDEKKKKKLYEGIAKSIDWKMPPSDYLWIHKDARLTRAQREEIKKWAEKEAAKLP
ncbi:heme-binding domain-containing protein [Nitratifractor sp.]